MEDLSSIEFVEEKKKMIDDKMYETCKDCLYCYREVNQCMYGEEGVPDDLEKKCEEKNK